MHESSLNNRPDLQAPEVFSFARYSNQVALISQDRELNYADLAAEVDNLKINLLEQGIRSGDAVAVCEPNTESLVILLAALISLETLIIPINPRWPETKQQAWYSQLGARFLVRIRPGDPSLPVRVDLVKLADTMPQSEARSGFLIATSGSSGSEKAVWLNFDHFILSAEASRAEVPLGPGDIWWLSLPLCHVGGISVLFRCFMQGAAVCLHEIRNMTHVSFVPTQLYRVLHKEAESLLTRWPLLKALIVGGAACAESWVEAALAQNIPLYLTYGLSETASMICLVAAENRNAAGSVGKPLAHARIQINDQGEIMVKGHCLFNGYLEAGALKRVDQTDWFPTGDMGCLQHAELVVTGRRGYRFVCAGENIQPEAIEQCIKQLSSVEDVIVLASPDPEYGEVPIALLKLAHDQSFVRADVERLIRKELGGLYLPRRWFSLPDQQDNLKWKRKQLALMVEEGALFEFPNT